MGGGKDERIIEEKEKAAPRTTCEGRTPARQGPGGIQEDHGIKVGQVGYRK